MLQEQSLREVAARLLHIQDELTECVAARPHVASHLSSCIRQVLGELAEIQELAIQEGTSHPRTGPWMEGDYTWVE